MKIVFANMGHGETIYIRNRQEEYIRDFGEYSPRPQLQSACHVDDILNNTCQNKDCVFLSIRTENRFNAILSHPHKDHFSGFESLFRKNLTNKNKIFKTCYLSKIIQPQSLMSPAFENFICHLFLLAKTQNKFSNFLLHLPVMSALSQKLVFCSAREQLPFQVFTPRCSIVDDSVPEKRQEDFNMNFGSSFREKTNQIIEIIAKYIRNDNVDKQEAEDDYNKIYGLIENKKREDIFSVKDDSFLQKLYTLTSKQLDNGSLSFAMFDQKSSWLFLGDNYDNALRQAFAKTPPNVYYCGIKAAHHGTRGGNALLALQVHSTFCMMCTGLGHGTLSMPQNEYFKVSRNCFASDCLHRNCKKNCVFQKIKLCKLCKFTFDHCRIKVLCKNNHKRKGW